MAENAGAIFALMEIHVTTGASGWNAQGWATVVVAASIAIFTGLSFLINRQKLRLDLFQHRFAIYNKLKELLKQMPEINRQASHPYIKEINSCVHEARFLFSNEVAFEIRKLRQHASRFVHLNNLLRNAETRDKDKAYYKWLDEQQDVNMNISAQMATVRRKMMPYIGFTTVGVEGESARKIYSVYRWSRAKKRQYINWVDANMP